MVLEMCSWIRMRAAGAKLKLEGDNCKGSWQGMRAMMAGELEGRGKDVSRAESAGVEANGNNVGR